MMVLFSPNLKGWSGMLIEVPFLITFKGMPSSRLRLVDHAQCQGSHTCMCIHVPWLKITLRIIDYRFVVDKPYSH